MEPYLKKISTTSVVQRVIDCLTDAMLNGELKPGDKIPTEIMLSQQLGVARNSIREAIKILVYIGVLEIRRAEGTFVSNGFSESLVDPMIYGIILNQQNEMDLNELRAMVESGVMKLAILKCTEEELEELHTCLKNLKAGCLAAHPDKNEVFELDNAFHDKITDMGHNLMVTKINAMVRVLTHSTRLHSVDAMLKAGRGEELYLAHAKVYRLLATRNTSDLYESISATYFPDAADC